MCYSLQHCLHNYISNYIKLTCILKNKYNLTVVRSSNTGMYICMMWKCCSDLNCVEV